MKNICINMGLTMFAFSIRLCFAMCAVIIVIWTMVNIYDSTDFFVVFGEKSPFVNLKGFNEYYLASKDRLQSTCSDSATSRGPHQQVVSFSFYGSINHERNYFKGIEENVKLMDKFYPNWIMRVYHEIPPLETNETSSKNECVFFERFETRVANNSKETVEDWTCSAMNATPQEILLCLQCFYTRLDFCYMKYIPGFGNLLGSLGTMWRFLPMADPLVDVFVSRDLDSRPSDREVAAVKEWLNYNITFHIMRDHPYHNFEILGGMWGAINSNDRIKLAQITRIIMDKARTAKSKGMDQVILGKVLWPIAKGQSVQHDSYFCKKYRGKRNYAWPTRRIPKEKYNFVGARINIDGSLSKICPLECRPKNKTHWIHC